MGKLDSDEAYPMYIGRHRQYPTHERAFQEWCHGAMPSTVEQLNRLTAMLSFLVDEGDRIKSALEYFLAVKTLVENSGITLEQFILLGERERDACLHVNTGQAVSLETLSRFTGEVGTIIRNLAQEKMKPKEAIEQ